MAATRYRTIDEFWPYYVREHSKPLNRWLHFLGNTNLCVWLILALLRRRMRLAIIGVLSSYALAWIGHFGIQRNIPATFRYPVMSAICDLIMYRKMWQGAMDAEVARYTEAPAHEALE
jgi:hypothetical protein